MEYRKPQTIFKKLDNYTLAEIATNYGQLNLEEEAPKSEIVNQLAKGVENMGIKQITQMMKRNTLKDICDYHEIDHKENNGMNRMVLSKRVYEQMSKKGVSTWCKQCKDTELMRAICDDLGIAYLKKTTQSELRKLIEGYIIDFGTQIFFNKLDYKTLYQCASELNIQNIDSTKSSVRLREAVLTNKAVVPPEKKKKQRKTKKVAIEKATTTIQLSQHYYAKDLKQWCEDNGLKTTGNKTTLVRRIINFNLGDKENAMKTTNSSKGGKTKKNNSKKSKKSNKKNKEPEPQDDDEEETDNEEENIEEMVEEQEENDVEEIVQDDDDEDEDEDEEDEELEDFAGYIFHVEKTEDFNILEYSQIVEVIRQLNGKVINKLTKKCTHYMVPDVEAGTDKIIKSRKNGIEVVSESLLEKYIETEDPDSDEEL